MESAEHLLDRGVRVPGECLDTVGTGQEPERLTLSHLHGPCRYQDPGDRVLVVDHPLGGQPDGPLDVPSYLTTDPTVELPMSSSRHDVTGHPDQSLCSVGSPLRPGTAAVAVVQHPPQVGDGVLADESGPGEVAEVGLTILWGHGGEDGVQLGQAEQWTDLGGLSHPPSAVVAPPWSAATPRCQQSGIEKSVLCVYGICPGMSPFQKVFATA